MTQFYYSGHPGVRSRYATLSVLVAPDAPIITQGANLVTTEGREIRLECVSANGRPPSEVSFTLRKKDTSIFVGYTIV